MNKIFKSAIAAVLTLSIAFSLCACESPKGSPKTAAAAQTSEQTSAQSTDSTAAPTQAPKGDIKTSLFIGDSRTVGLKEYSNLPSDFFCDVGLSAKNSLKKELPVEGVGKVTLDALLTKKAYSRVYIMLGINEIGGRLEAIVNNYSDVVEFVKSKQPDAQVVIMANLHVTKERSDSDAAINNEAIDRFNNEVKKLADGKTVFYIDVNSVFDDGDHALKNDMTSDNVHLYAKYYKEWAAWIEAQPIG